MLRRRKIVIGTVACAFAVLILLLAVVIIAPKAIDTETVKAKVRSELLKVAGVEIDFEHLVLDFFPRPHVIIDRVDLAIPPGVKGKAASVTVQPKILPLFGGKMKIAGLYLDSAELNYILPQRLASEKTTSKPFPLQDLGKRIQAVVATLPEFKIPNLDFRVSGVRRQMTEFGGWKTQDRD